MFQSAPIKFPFIGSLVDDTSIDDRIWTALNAIVCAVSGYLLCRKILVQKTSRVDSAGIDSFSDTDKELFDLKRQAAGLKRKPVFEVFTDTRGNFRFRLKAVNDEVILQGEAFREKKSCLECIEKIRKYAPAAPVNKV